MKNHSLFHRFKYAFNGIMIAARTEPSFQTQLICMLAAFATLAYFKAAAQWYALFAITIAGVLAAELVNTALENLTNCLHPGEHPKIGLVKDCAAGAVLVFSLASVAVLIAFLAQI